MRLTACVLATFLALTSAGALADEAGVGSPLPFVPISLEIKKLVASDPETGDEFGYAVAISGDTMVIGDWRGDDACPSDPACDSGSAYVFQRNEGGTDNWGQVKKLTASDAAQYDSFGRSVAISGDRIVVGAPAMSNMSSYGAAYVFERNRDGANKWGERIKLQAKFDKGANDKFGLSVGISGTTVLVGAPQNDDSGEGTGSAYFFERDYPTTDTWDQIKKITAIDRYGWDWFGYSVAISGDTAIVGALLEDGGAGNPLSNAGAAYIFERDLDGDDNWGEIQKIAASDIAANDEFGVSVAISGDTAVVGSNRNDDACPGDAGCDSGSAYVFERDQGGADNWGQTRKLTADDDADGDELGISVAISGDTIVVGALRANAAGTDSGAAYLFSRNVGGDGMWGQLQKFIGSSTSTGDETGRSVGISGQTSVVGSPSDDSAGTDTGSAYVSKIPELTLTFFVGEVPAEQ